MCIVVSSVSRNSYSFGANVQMAFLRQRAVWRVELLCHIQHKTESLMGDTNRIMDPDICIYISNESV